MPAVEIQMLIVSLIGAPKHSELQKFKQGRFSSDKRKVFFTMSGEALEQAV